MTENQKPICIHCERDNAQVPLLAFTYKDIEAWICTEHIPVLIHDPHKLVGKLPGAENLNPVETA